MGVNGRLGDVLSRLDDLEEVVWEPYHKDGPGRPLRNPLGIFKALIVKRIRNIPSDRELYRRLWNNPKLREICDIEDYEKPYHPSQLTRFRQRVGPERLERIMDSIVEKLGDARVIKGEVIACDAKFISFHSSSCKREREEARSKNFGESR